MALARGSAGPGAGSTAPHGHPVRGGAQKFWGQDSQKQLGAWAEPGLPWLRAWAGSGFPGPEEISSSCEVALGFLYPRAA